ncbi:hypothetical protein XENOCAPTIV_018070, partial [Xenoophorus captivus]
MNACTPQFFMPNVVYPADKNCLNSENKHSRKTKRVHQTSKSPETENGLDPCRAFFENQRNAHQLNTTKYAPTCTKRRKMDTQESPKHPTSSCMLDFVSSVDQQNSEVPSGPSAQQHQTQLDSIFMLLEDNMVSFVKNELKKIQKVLSLNFPECCDSQRDEMEVFEGKDEEQRRSSREAFEKITLNFLKKMKQEDLAERLKT